MYTIEELIPQRPPIVMVDEFLGIDDGVSHTRLSVRGDNLFFENGTLNACGIIEHIAQSAASRVGYICRSQSLPVPIGYIGSVNDFSVERLPREGEQIHTSIRVVQEVFGISLIEARCTDSAGGCLAGCKMKIFLEQ